MGFSFSRIACNAFLADGLAGRESQQQFGSMLDVMPVLVG